MNPITKIAGIAVVVLVIALGVVGKLYIDSVERVGELKVEVRNKQAIIDQKEHDANLSAKLDAIQLAVEMKLLANVGNTREKINNAQDDDSAAAAALDSVRRSRAIGSGQPSP